MEPALEASSSVPDLVVVQLQRDAEKANSFSLTVSSSRALVGFQQAAGRLVRLGELAEFGLLDGIDGWELSQTRVVAAGPAPEQLSVFELDGSTLDNLDCLVPGLWYHVDVVPARSTDAPDLDPEEETESELDHPFASGVEEQPSADLEVSHRVQDDVEQARMKEREVNTVPKPMAGLNPMAAGWEPERIIDDLVKRVAWEREQRLIAEAECDRLRQLIEERERAEC